MAKSKKKKPQKGPEPKPKSTIILPEKIQDVIFCSIIIILLAILFKPMLIDSLSPQGADIVAGVGKVNQIREFNQSHEERALWNPYIFSGMPHYQDYGAIAFSIDNILGRLGFYLSSAYVFCVFGALGMYSLLRYLKFNPLLAFAGSMMFILLPHYKSLWIVGHFRKLRAIMYIPWIFLSFKYFIDKRSLLSITLFTIFFAVQIRTQHYQIIFYTALLIFAMGIYPFLSDLFEKKYKIFAKSVIMLSGALIFSLMMSAQPLFLAKEYLPYSKRGKTTIDITKSKEQQSQTAISQGASLEYATQWSTAPSELLTWLFPRFYGGMSQEKYTGNNYPQLKNQLIPFYWGHMPFTQSYEYIGVIVLLLSFIGVYAYRKNRFIISMLIFVSFLILLSFGRHFLWFYEIFYNYLPYFNKFRAPMMSVTVTSFIIVIFALYGLRYLSEIKRGEAPVYYKNLFIIFGGFFLLGIIIWLFGQNFSFTKTGESFDPKIWNLIKEVRKEVFINDVLRYLFIVVLTFVSIWGYIKKKFSFTLLSALLTLFILFDLINLQSRYDEKYIDAKKVEKNFFKKTNTDLMLERDSSIYRVFPVGKLFQNNRWAYYHQTIGGYSPIKMYTIEELIQNNLYKGWNKDLPINWNVMKILNVKYLISPQSLRAPQLEEVSSNTKNNQLKVYYFKDDLYRGFFVGETEIIKDEFDRLKRINQATFDPGRTAIIEVELSQPISEPDSSYSKLLTYNPNGSVFDVYTDKTSLFVISELYYPPGWKIFIDNNEVENIYKTNHAIQSVVVPEGNHKIELRFEPDSYYDNIKLASISSFIVYLVIVSSLIYAYKDKILSKLRKSGGTE